MVIFKSILQIIIYGKVIIKFIHNIKFNLEVFQNKLIYFITLAVFIAERGIALFLLTKHASYHKRK
jgi:hypothetical protein